MLRLLLASLRFLPKAHLVQIIALGTTKPTRYPISKKRIYHFIIDELGVSSRRQTPMHLAMDSAPLTSNKTIPTSHSAENISSIVQVMQAR